VVPEEVRNLRVPARSLRRLRKTATALDLEKRLALPGLDPRRGDLMVAGAVLLDSLLRRLGADEITLCDLALREGLVLDYVHRHRKDIARVDRYPDVRRRSTIELAERCNWEADHARQVARLALALFEQTRFLHGLSDREQEWLEYAAFLHDVGNHVSYERHHRHSYYLIKNGDLRGFEPEEIEVIALVARYHRRAPPKRSHEGYKDLDPHLRRTVRVLSAFLRMAEALDRSQHGMVKAVAVKDRGDDLRLQIEATGDAELEVWAANHQTGVLADALGRKFTLAKVATDSASRRAAARPRRAGARGRSASPRPRNTELTRQKLA
jgi:exopolyphosphatase/guanosine-5'-triphosphate,3'-diphosphate pyrophosphatase